MTVERFDPWVALRDCGREDGPAKIAKPAKVQASHHSPPANAALTPAKVSRVAGPGGKLSHDFSTSLALPTHCDATTFAALATLAAGERREKVSRCSLDVLARRIIAAGGIATWEPRGHPLRTVKLARFEHGPPPPDLLAELRGAGWLLLIWATPEERLKADAERALDPALADDPGEVTIRGENA